MDAYIEDRASSSGELFATLNFASLWHHWQARRSVRQLSKFDDYMLRDLGLTRADVEWATRLPLSENAVLRLEDRAFRRGRFGDA